jgi:hypothetical protein
MVMAVVVVMLGEVFLVVVRVITVNDMGWDEAVQYPRHYLNTDHSGNEESYECPGGRFR